MGWVSCSSKNGRLYGRRSESCGVGGSQRESPLVALKTVLANTKMTQGKTVLCPDLWSKEGDSWPWLDSGKHFKKPNSTRPALPCKTDEWRCSYDAASHTHRNSCHLTCGENRSQSGKMWLITLNIRASHPLLKQKLAFSLRGKSFSLLALNMYKTVNNRFHWCSQQMYQLLF